MNEITINPVKFNERPSSANALLDAALAYVLASVTDRCTGRKFAIGDTERYLPSDTIGIRYIQRVASVKLDEFRSLLCEPWGLRLDPWSAMVRWDAASDKIVLWLEHSDGSRWPRV